jgi:hypothetical protein
MKPMKRKAAFTTYRALPQPRKHQLNPEQGRPAESAEAA